MAAYNPNRPSDSAFVQVLCERFLVEPCVIVAWLKHFDFKAETERQASEFQPPLKDPQ